MIHVPAQPFHRRTKRLTTPPAPVSLTLVSATYAPSLSVTLTFDRAIDVSGLVGSAISVDDGQDARSVFHATAPATLVSPNVVRLALVYVGESTSDDVRLNATSGSRIIAADDGGVWAGVSELALPFP